MVLVSACSAHEYLVLCVTYYTMYTTVYKEIMMLFNESQWVAILSCSATKKRKTAKKYIYCM